MREGLSSPLSDNYSNHHYRGGHTMKYSHIKTFFNEKRMSKINRLIASLPFLYGLFLQSHVLKRGSQNSYDSAILTGPQRNLAGNKYRKMRKCHRSHNGRTAP